MDPSGYNNDFNAFVEVRPDGGVGVLASGWGCDRVSACLAIHSSRRVRHLPCIKPFTPVHPLALRGDPQAQQRRIQELERINVDLERRLEQQARERMKVSDVGLVGWLDPRGQGPCSDLVSLVGWPDGLTWLCTPTFQRVTTPGGAGDGGEQADVGGAARRDSTGTSVHVLAASGFRSWWEDDDIWGRTRDSGPPMPSVTGTRRVEEQVREGAPAHAQAGAYPLSHHLSRLAYRVFDCLIPPCPRPTAIPQRENNRRLERELHGILQKKYDFMQATKQQQQAGKGGPPGAPGAMAGGGPGPGERGGGPGVGLERTMTRSATLGGSGRAGEPVSLNPRVRARACVVWVGL